MVYIIELFEKYTMVFILVYGALCLSQMQFEAVMEKIM